MVLIQKGELVFVRLLLPLILGIVAGFFLPAKLGTYHLALLLAVLSFIAVWISNAFYNRYKLYLSRWKPGLILNFFVFFVTVALTLAKKPELSRNHFSKFNDQALAVVVSSEPKRSNNILRFEARVKQGLLNNSFQPRDGLLLITLKLSKSKPVLQYGDQLLISSGYHEVAPPYNPYEFNYKAFLSNRGIQHQIFLNESEIQFLSPHPENSVIAYSLALRRAMVLKYSKYIRNNEAAAVASTLILGYKADLSREVLSAYSKTGTMHVLSVSGMHVGIVFYILNASLWFMSRNKALRIIRAVLIISLIWFYALITGFSPSVCRAAVMLSIYVLGKAVYRNNNSYNLVATSAVFLLVYNPLFLFDVGFQLSYLAVLGLIYFYPKIYHLFYIKSWFFDKIWSYIALSCAAQLATFPLGMYYFYQFPVYFIFSNLFIVLPVIVVMYLGIAFLFIPWDSLLEPLGWLLERGITLMNQGLYYIENLPLASVSSYHGLSYYLLVYLFIGCLALSFQIRSKNILYAACACLFLLVSLYSINTFVTLNERSVTFYSLRKNTAFSFFSKDKAYVFSDLDSTHSTMSFSVHSALKAKSEHARFYNLKRANDGNGDIYTSKNFFQFGNWKMMIWDTQLNNYHFSHPIRVDALLLSGRPKLKISELLKNVDFKVLIIDATNPDYLIEQWVEQASNLKLNYYVLKKKPAYSITLD